MAGPSILIKMILDGAQDVKKQFDDVRTTAAAAFDKIKGAQDTASAATRQFSDSVTGLKQNIQALGDQSAQAGAQLSTGFSSGSSAASTSVRTFGLTLAALGVAAVAAGAVMNSLGTSAIKAATDIQTAADKASLSTKAFQQFSFVGVQTGVDLSTITAATKQLSDQFVTANTKVGDMVGGLRKVAGTTTFFSDLGITVQRFGAAANAAATAANQLGIATVIGGDKTAAVRQTLLAYADAVAKGKTETDQLAIASFLLGKSLGPDILPFLQEGSKGIDTYLAEMKRLGIGLSSSQIDVATKAQQSIATFDLLFTDFKTKLGLLFAPELDARAKLFTEILATNRGAIQTFAKTLAGEVFPVLDRFAAYLSGALTGKSINADSIKALVTEVESFALSLKQAVTDIVLPALILVKQGFDFIATSINAAFGTNFTGTAIIAGAVLLSFLGIFSLFTSVLSPIVALVGGLVSLIGAGLAPVFGAAALGARVFWTELRAGGEAAFTAIKAEIPVLRTALGLLLSGDFAGAWVIFRAEAVAAFDAIGAAITKSNNPLAAFFRSLGTIFRGIVLVLDTAATLINAVFGTRLTASTLGFYLVLAQVLGVFTTLAPIMVLASTVLNRVGLAFTVISASLIILARQFPDLGLSWLLVEGAFHALLNGDFKTAITDFQEAFSGVWTNLRQEGLGTWLILGLGALAFASTVRSVFTALGGGLVLGVLKGLWTAFAGVVSIVGRIIVGALVGIVGTIGLIPTLIIAALIAAGVAIFLWWDEIKAAAAAAWDYIKAKSSDFWEWLKSVPGTVADALASFWEGVKTAASDAWDFIKTKASDFWEWLKSVPDTIGAALASFWEGVKSAASDAWEAIKTKISDFWEWLKAAPGAAFDAVITAVSAGWDRIKESFSSGGAAIKATFSEAWTSLKGTASGIFDGIVASADSVWSRIKAGANTLSTAVEPIFTALGNTIGGVVTGIVAGIASIFSGTIDKITSAASTIGGAISAVLDLISQSGSLSALIDTLRAPFDNLATQVEAVWTAIGSFVDAGFTSLAQRVQSLADQIGGMIASILAQLQAAADQAAALAAQAQAAISSAGDGLGNGGGDATQALATGGEVHGAGTSTSDSIPAWLSAGEFVMRASAVKHWGVGVMHMLNGLRAPVSLFRGGIPGFAMGGMPGLSPALAAPSVGGSGAGPGRPLFLAFGNQKFGPFTGSADAVEQLERAANRKSLLSTGTLPGWAKK